MCRLWRNRLSASGALAAVERDLGYKLIPEEQYTVSCIPTPDQ